MNGKLYTLGSIFLKDSILSQGSDSIIRLNEEHKKVYIHKVIILPECKPEYEPVEVISIPYVFQFKNNEQ